MRDDRQTAQATWRARAHRAGGKPNVVGILIAAAAARAHMLLPGSEGLGSSPCALCHPVSAGAEFCQATPAAAQLPRCTVKLQPLGLLVP